MLIPSEALWLRRSAAENPPARTTAQARRFYLLSFGGICYLLFMKKIIQVYVSKGEKYFVAECVDLPVVTQGKTLDELAENLKEAIALQLEDENPADFNLVDNPLVLASFEVEPTHAKA